jgi:hypothetical protein
MWTSGPGISISGKIRDGDTGDITVDHYQQLQEAIMWQRLRFKTALCGTATIAALWLSGCASRPHSFDQKSQIAVTDMATVAGRWDGKVWKRPKLDYVEGVLLMIKPDGEFNFMGEKLADFHLGTGALRVHDGRLVSDSSGRHADFVLYNRDGEAFLVGDVRGKAGDLLYVELTRTNSAR